MKKQLLSALLAGCLVVGCIGPVSAADITTSGGTGETQVKVEVAAPIFSVTVPTALAVNVAADGTVTTSSNAEIINNCSGPVKVESVTAAAAGNWEMAAWSDTDTLSGEKVGAKKFALSINGTGVAADGSCEAVFDSIAAKDKLPFKYAAHVAPQKTAINAEDNEQMAKVVFTIGWDEVPAVVIGGWDVSAAQDRSVTATLTDDGVMTISGQGKMKDYNLTKQRVPYYDERLSIETVVLEDGVTSIGNVAFDGCTSLTSVTIGDGVTSIGNVAFRDCTALTSVTIGNSVTSIGEYAFNGCTALTSIEIPDSVTSIETSAFSSCTSLASITIPDGVTNIGHHAFYLCSALTSITIPDSVTSIETSAFSDCNSLTSVTIGDGVTSIGEQAFGGCTALKSITIPDSVTSIGYCAFGGCTSLASITISDSVTSIGNNALTGCISLTSITYKGDEYKTVDKFKNAFTAIEGNKWV